MPESNADAAFAPAPLRHRLGRFPSVLAAAAAVPAAADLRWKPDAERWSILEIAAHLLAESTLRDPAKAWPPLDLAEVASIRRYNERDPEEVLAAFAEARASNMAWLDSVLASGDWSLARIHPIHGPLAAGMLLASWAAHDALHLRQIARRLHDLAVRDAGPYSVHYAGEW
jgi:hypothetical protein